MKKILLLLLLFAGSAYAQDVNIPDVNFKAALVASNAVSGIALNASYQHIVVDSNTDGIIQESEALAVYAIDMISFDTVSSLEGLSAFTNLIYLRCRNSNLSSIDLSANTNLTYIDLSVNHLTSIDISMLTNLSTLMVSDNELTALNVSGLVNLAEIDCQRNNLTGIDLSTLVNLAGLNLKENQITSIDLSNNLLLYSVVLQDNALTSIDVSMLQDMTALYVGLNNLTALDVSACSALQVFDASWNNISSLDFSQNTNIVFVGCSNNNLQYLSIKNGRPEENINNQYVFSGNPTLQYICADDMQIPIIQQNLTDAGITTIMVGSYCSFVPGGDYNTITGAVHFDANANGCDSGDIVPLNLVMNLNDGSQQGNSAIDMDGNYTFFTGMGIFTVTPQLENPAYFTLNPPSAGTTFNVLGAPTFTQDFCLTANGAHPDLEISIAPLGFPRPGFTNGYKIVYKNKGTETLSGIVNFNYDASLMEYLDSTVLPDSFIPGAIGYNFTNLAPFGAEKIEVTLGLNAPTDTPPVNNGDTLVLDASITATPSADDTPLDNNFTLSQEVVGSFDPNNKICLEGEYASPSDIGKYLHYNVNFENTGTADAENIVVKDVIDTTKFDITTLQVIESSHAVRMNIVGNTVEFIFEGINLSPSTGRSVIGGHGNVLFKIKTLSTLNVGDMVTNTANIYFDYNFPIETNEARTTFAALSNTVFAKDDSISVYPNPANDWVQIKADTAIKTIEMFDVQGRILQHTSENKDVVSVDISRKSNGIYFLKITTATGSKVIKLVKE